jgi:hypothetical protein
MSGELLGIDPVPSTPRKSIYTAQKSTCRLHATPESEPLACAPPGPASWRARKRVCRMPSSAPLGGRHHAGGSPRTACTCSNPKACTCSNTTVVPVRLACAPPGPEPARWLWFWGHSSGDTVPCRMARVTLSPEWWWPW